MKPNSPPSADIRDGMGNQVGEGNIQNNYFQLNGAVPRAEKLPAAQPVTAWDPFALDIWRVLSLPGLTGSSAGLSELPPYVPRDHDKEIDAQLTDAVTRMIVVTGDSCTGKSRSLYEALHRHKEIRCWEMRYPAGPDQLLQLLTSGQMPPRTVLWLNDLEQFLMPAEGERVAGALLELLRDPSAAPVTVAATLWPEHWDTLSQEPEDGAPAPYPLTRQLLTRQSRRVRVADKFSGTSLRGLASVSDPRLVEAARMAGETKEVIQTLAGGPYLIDRYLVPGGKSQEVAFPRAVILAAIDARRLGLATDLPRRFLEQAALGYLDPETRLDAPSDWLDLGIRYAARSHRGVRALGPARWDTDRTGQADAYRLHDYLAQHGTRLREEELIPASFWEAASRSADLAGPMYLQLAQEAHRRLLYVYAYRCYRLAQAAGVADATEWLLAMLRKQGRDDLIQAEFGSVRDRAAQGDLAAHRLLVSLLREEARGHDEALPTELRTAYEDALRAGCEVLRVDFADELADSGATTDAIREFRRVLDLDPDASYARLCLIKLLARTGKTGQAAEVAYAAPAMTSQASLSALACELLDAGLEEQALAVVRTGTETGKWPGDASDHRLVERLATATGGAELLQLMAERGSRSAEIAYRQVTASSADQDELRQRDDPEAREELARRLAGEGQESDLRDMTDAGDQAARWHLTLLLEKEGRIAEAIEILRPAADAAAVAALGAVRREPPKLVRLLEKAGQHDALHELVLSNRFVYRRPLVDWAYRNKRRADLEHLARGGVDRYPPRRLAWLLRDTGDDDAFAELATRSGAGYREWIDSLVDRGETQELYRRVLLGEGYARRTLKRLIDNHDPRIPADTLRRSGLTPTGEPAEPISPEE